MAERGVYRNTVHARKLGRFDGMRWGTITPTDLDFATDFHGRLFVYAEAKYGTTELPTGQRILLERQCDLMHRPPARYAVAFVVSHWERGDFHFASTLINRYRWEGLWQEPKTPGQTLMQGINVFRQRVLGEVPVESNEHDDWLADYERTEKEWWRKPT